MGRYYTNYAQDPGRFVSDDVYDWVREHRDEFRDYWGLDAEEPPEDLSQEVWNVYRLLDRLTEKFFQAARTLQQPDEGDYVSLIKDMREESNINLTSSTFVQQRFELEVFEELYESPLRQARRALELLELLVSVDNRHARRYLERVAECYIKGLRTETVVMCGAALEAALGDFVSDEEVRAGLDNLRHNSRVSTGDRIKYIDQKEMVSQAVVEKAKEINTDRNDAVHFTPGIVADPKGNIKLLADVLRALEPPEWLEEGEDPW